MATDHKAAMRAYFEPIDRIIAAIDIVGKLPPTEAAALISALAEAETAYRLSIPYFEALDDAGRPPETTSVHHIAASMPVIGPKAPQRAYRRPQKYDAR